MSRDFGTVPETSIRRWPGEIRKHRVSTPASGFGLGCDDVCVFVCALDADEK